MEVTSETMGKRTLKFGLTPLIAIALLSSELVFAKVCEKWEKPSVLGYLDTKHVPEASGLAVSRQFKRFYHINDSGNQVEFFSSKRDGEETMPIGIAGFSASDTEDMALGPCPLTKDTCIAVGDIGDNRERRSSINIAFIQELETFPKSVTPQAIRSFRYPDRAHNAESMAVLPNGDLIIITKEKIGGTSFIFRARKSSYVDKASEAVVLEKIGEFNFYSVTKDKFLGGLATGMTVSSDGKKFAVLTYNLIVEFNVDLSQEDIRSKDWKEGVEYRIVPSITLSQQESISYDDDEQSLIYTTEFANIVVGSRRSVPIMRVGCSQ